METNLGVAIDVMDARDGDGEGSDRNVQGDLPLVINVIFSTESATEVPLLPPPFPVRLRSLHLHTFGFEQVANKHTAKMAHTRPEGEAAESQQATHDRLLSPEAEGYEDEIDTAAVTKPVLSRVHGCMRSGWRINKQNPMWLIFDAVNPVRVFKAKMLYDEGADFPEFDPEALQEVTDVDDESGQLMPFAPIEHQ